MFVNPKGEFVSLYDLPLRAKMMWIIYLAIHPRTRHAHARASWANILDCLGVKAEAAASLVVRAQRADSIPSVLDAPVQITTLANFALICFILGMKDVKIGTEEGTINARNEFARIFTINQNVPGVAAVISLEGDLDGLRGLVAQPSTRELIVSSAITNGRLNLVRFFADPYVFDPYSILYAFENNWSQEQWNLYSTHRRLGQEPLKFGNLIWEAQTFDEHVGKDMLVCPSLIQSFAFLPYHSVVAGFPFEAYLFAYNADFLSRARRWWTSGGKDICDESTELHRKALRGDIPFLRSTGSFSLVVGDVTGYNGSRTWIFHSARSMLNSCREPTSLIASLTRNDNDGSADKFPMVPAIYRLLNGETLHELKWRSRQERADGLAFISSEGALWLTLLLLEARIQALWDVASKGQQETEAYGTPKTSSAQGINHTHGTMVLEFLASWLEVCRCVHALSPISDVASQFEEILSDWRDNHDPCIPEPRHNHPTHTPTRFTKNQFYVWAEQGSRKRTLLKLLKWFQLRTIVMYFYLQAHGDSSKVSNMLLKPLQVYVA
jgi:hypothetical protein